MILNYIRGTGIDFYRAIAGVGETCGFAFLRVWELSLFCVCYEVFRGLSLSLHSVIF